MAGGTSTGKDESGYCDVALDALGALLVSLSESERAFVEKEFRRIMEDPKMRGKERMVMPYLYAATFLSFSGREINEANLSKVLSVAGIAPNSGMMSAFLATGVKSHLTYIYAYYFLLALGKRGSEKEIVSMLDSLGIEADKTRIGEVSAFLSELER